MASNSTKKRKRDSLPQEIPDAVPDTSKPTAVFKPSKGRPYTVSVALPGSIIANAQTHDLKTALAGQLARALAVFCVDEIVIFSDGAYLPPRRNDNHHDPRKQQLAAQDEENGYTAFSDPDNFLFHVLSYLETPPYLRRSLFAYHPNLRTAGVLPSLDMPHHLRAEEWCQYREGVTVDSAEQISAADSYNDRTSSKKPSKKQKSSTTPATTLVNTGFPTPVTISTSIPPNTRVTLQFASPSAPSSYDNLTASAISPDVPREEGGYYWGYTPRLASSLSAVFTECPYEGGYDYSVGTSERGIPLRDLLGRNANQDAEDESPEVPEWRHLLVLFGGLAGLEKALKSDEELEGKVQDPSELFDAWVNLVEGQGSRTIRTEEAVWIGLMGLREVVADNESRLGD